MCVCVCEEGRQSENGEKRSVTEALERSTASGYTWWQTENGGDAIYTFFAFDGFFLHYLAEYKNTTGTMVTMESIVIPKTLFHAFISFRQQESMLPQSLAGLFTRLNEMNEGADKTKRLQIKSHTDNTLRYLSPAILAPN